MIRINLLPHREIKRKQQQKHFFVGVGIFAVIGVLAWYAGHLWLEDELNTQNVRNKYLEAEIANIDKQIEEIKKLKEQTAALLQRKKVVESLQANRAETVYLLDQLVRQMPDGVYLKAVSQKGDRVSISGFAQSNARVSTFMRNLEASPYLEKPRLVEIKAITDKSSRTSEFSLVVMLTRATEDTAGKKPATKSAAGAIPTAQVVAPAAQSAGSAQGKK
jgi:type IV pilus assembly protein PilN